MGIRIGRASSRRRLGPREPVALLLPALGLVMQLGCGNDPATPVPNQPPTTDITGGPLEGSRVPARVTFFWLGSDIDGARPSNYDYIVETYPRAVSRFDEITLAPPAPADARWVRVTANQITMPVLADTLRADPQGDIGAGEFDRWHTFWIRAIDNELTIDETPDHRTFQAYTQAPRIDLLWPAEAATAATLPRTFVLHWDGSDPLGGGNDPIRPRESRWALVPATLDGGGQPLGFPAALYALPDTTWSDWAIWVDADSSGTSATFRDLVPNPDTRTFVFAVQGRDESGAVTPQFDSTTPEWNNYAALVIDGTLAVGPRITVHSLQDTLSSWTFDGDVAVPILVPTTEDTVTVYWDRPTASHYGAQGRECRYGWNITNPNDEQQWTAWSTTRIAPPRRLDVGTNRFFIQCRDDLVPPQLTTGQIQFQRTASSAARRGRELPP
jgi:hypothetical protein